MDYKILFALTSFLVLLNACERNAGGKSKLSIQFPEVIQSGKISAMTANGSSSDDWSSTTPTGFSGAAPFNCFGVYISGPEAALRTNQCFKDKTATTPMKVFGKWKGGVLQGKTLDFEIDAGKDRVVGVFGFHAADPSACKDFTGTAEMNQSQLSKPYFLGEVGQLEFIGGQTKEVAVNLSFDSNQSFEECKGPDFQNGSGGGGGSTPVYGDFGTGADGDLTISAGMSDPRNITSPLKSVPLITSTRVMALNVGTSAKNLIVGTKLTGLSSKFVVGDEVALYVAAGNSCGNTVVGFRTRGIIQTVASTELNINVDDERFASITTSALSATAAGTFAGRNFCRLIVTRVPNFNTLTFNGSNGANIAFNAASFGDMSNDSGDHEAGIVIIRVKDKVILTTSGGIDVATRGYNGGSYSKDGQGYDGANTDAPTTFAVNGSGGSGGSSSPSIHPGGGGHGGAGGNGLANGAGGLVVGDQYGCSSSSPDLSMPCLFGKVFMGGGGGGGYDAAGGSGGGLILLDAKAIELNGNSFVLNADGGNPFSGSTMGGAGGAGGSVRVIAQTITGAASSEMKLRSNGGYSKTPSGLGLGRGGSGGGGRNHLHVTGSCSVPTTAIALEAYSPSQYDNTIQGFGGAAGSNRVDGAGIATCNGIAQNITPFITRFYPTSATADITFGATVTVYGESLSAVTSAVLQNTMTPSSQYTCTISNQSATKFDCLTTAPAAQYHLIVTGAGGRKTTYQAGITLN